MNRFANLISTSFTSHVLVLLFGFYFCCFYMKMRNQSQTITKQMLSRDVYLIDIKSGDGSLPLSFDTNEINGTCHLKTSA